MYAHWSGGALEAVVALDVDRRLIAVRWREPEFGLYAGGISLDAPEVELLLQRLQAALQELQTLPEDAVSQEDAAY